MASAARVLAVGVALAAATAACGSNPGALEIPGEGRFGAAEGSWTGDAGPTVVVLGDSITNLARDALHQRLAGYRVRIAGVIGEGYAGGPVSAADGRPVMAEVAEEYAELEPDVVVLALGTNDSTLPDLTLDASAGALGAMAELFGSSCIVGVQVNEGITGAGFDPGDAAGINEALRSVADQVVDIRELATAQFEPDGVHPPPAATGPYAALVGDAVGRCAPPAA